MNAFERKVIKSYLSRKGRNAETMMIHNSLVTLKENAQDLMNAIQNLDRLKKPETRIVKILEGIKYIIVTARRLANISQNTPQITRGRGQDDRDLRNSYKMSKTAQELASDCSMAYNALKKGDREKAVRLLYNASNLIRGLGY